MHQEKGMDNATRKTLLMPMAVTCHHTPDLEDNDLSVPANSLLCKYSGQVKAKAVTHSRIVIRNQMPEGISVPS